jgi:hypothetical protein
VCAANSGWGNFTSTTSWGGTNNNICICASGTNQSGIGRPDVCCPDTKPYFRNINNIAGCCKNSDDTPLDSNGNCQAAGCSYGGTNYTNGQTRKEWCYATLPYNGCGYNIYKCNNGTWSLDTSSSVACHSDKECCSTL